MNVYIRKVPGEIGLFRDDSMDYDDIARCMGILRNIARRTDVITLLNNGTSEQLEMAVIVCQRMGIKYTIGG